MDDNLLKEYARELGRKGGKANKGTAKAKIRASKAARARWSMHAPSNVREAFRNAIEAFVQWNDDEPEPTVEYQEEHVTISEACGLLWNCTDILPRGDFDWLGSCAIEPKSQTYAAAARAMLQAIKEAKA